MNPGVEITTGLWVKALQMASELQWLVTWRPHIDFPIDHYTPM